MNNHSLKIHEYVPKFFINQNYLGQLFGLIKNNTSSSIVNAWNHASEACVCIKQWKKSVPSRNY